MDSSSFKNKRWAESNPSDSGTGEIKQKIRFNVEEETLSVAESASQSDFTNLISSLVTTNRLLHDEIRQIQKDHRRTLKTLTHCCRLKSEENLSTDHNPRGILKKRSTVPSSKECKKVCESCSRIKQNRSSADKSAKERAGDDQKKDQESLTEITSCSSSYDPDSGEEDEISDYIEDLASPERESISSDRVSHRANDESPGLDAIKSMWDNFSLKDYDFVTLVDGPIVKTKHSSNGRRKYTVPEPFNMTIRESPKKHKCSDVSRQVEDHQSEVRIQPIKVPASTLMPIYELMRAKNEQKREDRRKDVVNKLKSSVKPFSFEARELQKQDRREEQMRLEEEINHLKPKTFKARTIPSKLFDPEVKERMLEDEDYRRIRRKMRSHELLSNSKLPNRMHKSVQQQSSTNQRERSNEEEHWFHPKITHEIPDYEEGYLKLRNKLAEKKLSKILTIPQPFKLRTEEVSQRRKHKLTTRDHHDEDTKAKRALSSSKLSRQPPLPTHTTQAQQLRQKKVQEMKSMLQLKEMEEEEKLRAKKIERHMMKKIVKEASDKMYSSTLELEEKRKKQAEDRR